MNVLFTLCGRAGSKGFKNKNIKSFLGIPLIYYSIAPIILYLNSEASTEQNIKVSLNTDSEELIDLAERQTALQISVIRRDKTLSGALVPKVSVIHDCLEKMETLEGIQFDIVVDLDITSPLRTLGDLKKAINKKIDRNDTDVVFSVTKARRNPYFNMVKQDGNYYIKAMPSNYTTRQQTPNFYDMNGSIYVYSVEALKHKDPKGFFNDKCDVIFMKDTGILDIDSEEDFELMQIIAEYLYKNNDDYQAIYQTAQNIYIGK